MIRIVIIDGQREERELIKNMITAPGEFEIVGTGIDGYDTLVLAGNLKPDIILLDNQIPMIDWGTVISVIKSRSPGTSIIVLYSREEEHNILKAIHNGASGCLAKNTGRDRLITGIKTVYNGDSLISPELYAKAYSRFAKPFRYDSSKCYSLTSKTSPSLPANISRIELRLITLIGKGHSNREIAKVLGLKEGTIRNHITLIFQKTGLRNRTQVAIYANHMGLVAEAVPNQRG
jgi:DNA-binding NarL/FixJ family response regulator